jgi:hypothetical protein
VACLETQTKRPQSALRSRVVRISRLQYVWLLVRESRSHSETSLAFAALSQCSSILHRELRRRRSGQLPRMRNFACGEKHPPGKTRLRRVGVQLENVLRSLLKSGTRRWGQKCLRRYGPLLSEKDETSPIATRSWSTGLASWSLILTEGPQTPA